MTLITRILERLNLNAFCYEMIQHLQKNKLFQFFSSQSLRDEIRPCHKIGQGQPRVVIHLNFVELDPSPPLPPKMLHTKFQDNKRSGTGVYWHEPNILNSPPPSLPTQPYVNRLHMKFNRNRTGSFRGVPLKMLPYDGQMAFVRVSLWP